MAEKKNFPRAPRGPPPPPPPPGYVLCAGAPAPPAPPPPPPPPAGGKAAAPVRTRKGKSVTIEESAARLASKTFVSVKDRSSTGYVGLSNQGATCYLNSLLQSLYMTPEFRERIYFWKYHELEDGRKDYCIPLQLQQLFARLQFAKCEAVGTAALTHSFRWDDAESFQQHDVQELCRVLFEALDKSFLQGMLRGESDIPTVSEMVEGVSANYLRCVECGFSRESIVSFQDIQLQVRGVSDIRESLGAFVQAERLDGDNQWECPQCNKKVDCDKGLKINQLPYLLTLHQMRFDLDYQTMMRVKLDNRVTFPEKLDMSPFVDNERASESDTMYELYSIMIHSGGAMGGHYFCFIKSCANGKWFTFNDTSVTECTVEQLAGLGLAEAAEEVAAREGSVSGGDRGEHDKIHKADVTGSTSAYMLMYRRVDPARNKPDVAADLCPAFAKELVDRENEVFEVNKAANKKKMEMIKMRFFYEENGANESPLASLHRSKTLAEAIDLCIKELKSLPDDFPADRVRLRSYNQFTKKMGDSFEGMESKSLLELELPSLKQFMVETRAADATFTAVGTGVIELNVAQLTASAAAAQSASTDTWLTAAGEEFFTQPFAIEVNKTTTLGDLKSTLSPLVGIPMENLRVVSLDVGKAEARIVTVEDDKLLIEDLMFGDQDYVYAEFAQHSSDMSMVVERFKYEQNLIEISFNLPAEENQTENVVYDQMVTFDQRKTIRQLKEEGIGRLIGMKAEEFKLCRNLLSKEYKDEGATLMEADILDGMALFVQKGRPLRADEYKLRVYLYDPKKTFLVDAEKDEEVVSTVARADTPAENVAPPPAEKPRSVAEAMAQAMSDGAPQDLADVESKWFSTGPVMEVVVAEDETVDSVRARCLEHLLKLTIPGLSEDIIRSKHIRVREKTRHRVGGILIPGKTIKECMPFLRDRHEMALELLDEEIKTEDVAVVRVHRWYPETWSVDSKDHQELALTSECTIGQAVALLASLCGVAPEFAYVAKPLRSVSINTIPESVPDMNWRVNPDRRTGESPWMLRDGDVLLIKDARERDNIPDWIVRNRPKEKALRIYTRFDDDFEGDPEDSEPAPSGGDAASTSKEPASNSNV